MSVRPEKARCPLPWPRALRSSPRRRSDRLGYLVAGLVGAASAVAGPASSAEVGPGWASPEDAASVAAREGIPFSDGFPLTTPERVFPLSEVRPGQRGYGFTVFRGARLEPFAVEILGVLKGVAGPDHDAILARLSGRNIEFTGVISGMSGSPVYIDGRLVGAVAYRFGEFSREPIAGITPIEHMLPLLDRQRSRQAAGARPGPPAPRTDIAGRAPRSTDPLPVSRPERGSATPIATSVAVSGLDPRAAERLRVALPAGAALSVGGAPISLDANRSAEAGRVTALPIRPGAPIAALVAVGDVNLASIGTVTYVHGDDVLGFGHPFQSDGDVAFPMATAAIVNTLASARGSYKQGVPALEVGTILQDRLTAISGRIGGTPAPTVPLSVEVGEPGRGRVDRTEVRLVDSPIWLPIVTDAVLSSAVLKRLGASPGGTVELRFGLEVDDLYLEVRDAYAAPAPIEVAAHAARDAAALVALVARSRVGRPRIRRISVRLDVRREVAAYRVLGAEVLAPRVHPGDRVELRVRLEPFRGEERTVTLELTVPEDAPVGPARLHVGAGLALDRRDRRARGRLRPSTVAELLGVLASRRPDDAIYARLYFPQPGLRVGATVLPALPPTIAAAVASRTVDGAARIGERPGPEARRPLDGVLEGGRELSLEILPPLEPLP